MRLQEIVEQLIACGFECKAGPLEKNVAFINLMQLALVENIFAKEAKAMANALAQKIASNAGDRCTVCGTDRWDLTAGLCAKCRDDLGFHPDLQPCPFCGERKNIRLFNRHGMNFISCNICHASGPALPIEISAYEHWNNREHEVWLKEMLKAERD